MNCLSQEQLTRLALGLAEDAKLTAHLDECAACRAGLEAMQALRHELAEAHAKFERRTRSGPRAASGTLAGGEPAAGTGETLEANDKLDGRTYHETADRSIKQRRRGGCVRVSVGLGRAADQARLGHGKDGRERPQGTIVQMHGLCRFFIRPRARQAANRRRLDRHRVLVCARFVAIRNSNVERD